MGTINPAAELCARARALGVMTLVDAAQSAGHCPVDVQAIGCDFLVFSGHKILGPTGIGVLYGREERFAEMPPYQTRRRDDRARGLARQQVQARAARLRGRHAARRRGGRAARGDGLPRRRRPAEHLRARPRPRGVRLHAPERTGRRAAVRSRRGPRGAGQLSCSDDVHAHDVVTLADQHGIALRGGHHCNQPLHRKLGVPSSARASFYFYNTREEVDRLMEVDRKNPRVLQSLTLTIADMDFDFEELYQAVILDHSRKPRNFGPLPDATVTVSGDNPTCGDEIALSLKIDPARTSWRRWVSRAAACSICMASTSLMTTKIKGKTRAEAAALLEDFQGMITGKTPEAEAPKTLGDLRLLSGVAKFPQRIKCATLGWHALKGALAESGGGASSAWITTTVRSFDLYVLWLFC